MYTPRTSRVVAPDALGRARGTSFGFNVVGHITGSLGLGVAARSVMQLILQGSLPVAAFDLDPGMGRGGREQEFQRLCVDAFESLPYAINIFVLPPPSLQEFLNRYPQVVGADVLNVALSFWELPIIPTEWITTLDAMDAVVAVSDSMHGALQAVLSGPAIVSGQLPLRLPASVERNRARFGLSEDAVIFGTSFETFSDIQRKNPLAVIDAFLAGVGDRADAHLLIKVNNSVSTSAEKQVLAQVREKCAGHPRIRVLAEVLAYADVLALYKCVDVFVSLHRAEGLGLGPMEAMALGTPVIATAWSGNMTFMNFTNSCLVSYTLVPVNGTIKQYQRALLGDGAYWADPDVAEAASWMRRLAGDPALRARIGGRASEDIARYQAQANEGRFLSELETIWRNRSFLAPRARQLQKPRHMQQLLSERDLRISQLESDLRWITNRPSYRVISAAKRLLGKRRPGS